METEAAESHPRLSQTGTVLYSVIYVKPFMQGATSRGFVALSEQWTTDAVLEEIERWWWVARWSTWLTCLFIVHQVYTSVCNFDSFYFLSM